MYTHDTRNFPWLNEINNYSSCSLRAFSLLLWVVFSSLTAATMISVSFSAQWWSTIIKRLIIKYNQAPNWCPIQIFDVIAIIFLIRIWNLKSMTDERQSEWKYLNIKSFMNSLSSVALSWLNPKNLGHDTYVSVPHASYYGLNRLLRFELQPDS